MALTQFRTSVNASTLGLLVAALALGSGSTIAAVATASHPSAPAVTAKAPPAPATTQDSTGTSDTSSGGTNSANANAFGQQVVQQVKTCKAQAAAAGTHGIGQCVSGWVTQHNPGHTRHSH